MHFPVPVPTRASCVLAMPMTAAYVCTMCSRSDAQMSEIIRHQQRSMHGRIDGPYHLPSAVGAQSRTCKGSGIKHVVLLLVHHMPVGLQRS